MLSDKSLKVLLQLNLAAALCHLALVVAIAEVANLSLTLPVYSQHLTFVYDSSGAQEGFDLLPRLTKIATSFPLSALVLFIEAVTALVHLGNVFVWTPIYITFVENYMNPLRWCEYAITAGTMGAVVAFTSGVRDLTVLVTAGALVACLQAFGFLTEVVNRVQNGRWTIKQTWARLLPQALGYPLFALWVYIILYTFIYAGGAPCTDWFVTAVVVGEIALFASFTAPALYVYTHTPGDYAFGEKLYIILSLTSKAFLAIVLLIGTLQTTTFDGASVDQESTDRCPLLDVNGTNITIFDVY